MYAEEEVSWSPMGTRPGCEMVGNTVDFERTKSTCMLNYLWVTTSDLSPLLSCAPAAAGFVYIGFGKTRQM